MREYETASSFDDEKDAEIGSYATGMETYGLHMKFEDGIRFDVKWTTAASLPSVSMM